MDEGERDQLARSLAAAEEALDAAARARQDIVHAATHDLGNPLSTILLASVALQRTATGDDPDRPKKLEAITRAARRMGQILGEIADFASLQAGELDLTLSTEDARTLLDEAVRELQPLAAARGQTISGASEGAPAAVSCDRQRLQQVLAVLVGNAVSVGRPGENVELRLSRREDEVVFAVSDRGPGFSEEVRDHLFDRYATGREGPYKGTGLGLAIAVGIVRAMGGRIGVESTVGVGTTFSVALPAEASVRHTEQGP